MWRGARGANTATRAGTKKEYRATLGARSNVRKLAGSLEATPTFPGRDPLNLARFACCIAYPARDHGKIETCDELNRYGVDK